MQLSASRPAIGIFFVPAFLLFVLNLMKTKRPVDDDVDKAFDRMKTKTQRQ